MHVGGGGSGSGSGGSSGGGLGGHHRLDSRSKDLHHHHHHNPRAGPPRASPTAGISLAFPSCWRRVRRPLLLALGALGAVAVILRVLASEQGGGGGKQGAAALLSSASSKREQVTGVGRRWPSTHGQRKGAVKDTADPAFRPLEIAPFSGRPWRTAQTLEVSPVVATAFGVCEIHRVKAEDGAEIEGWLWFDEKDQINVLARLAPTDNEPPQQGGKEGEGGGKFLLFEQRKYGYEGLSLAPIGGLIEPGEEPLAAAKRELLEEAGLVSEHWTALGRYRISSTRGGGFLNVFLVDQCRPSRTRRASDDMEQQTRVLLSASELAAAVLEGRFKEAKWTQTVAMALLHLVLREREQGIGAGVRMQQ